MVVMDLSHFMNGLVEWVVKGLLFIQGMILYKYRNYAEFTYNNLFI